MFNQCKFHHSINFAACFFNSCLLCFVIGFLSVSGWMVSSVFGHGSINGNRWTDSTESLLVIGAKGNEDGVKLWQHLKEQLSIGEDQLLLLDFPAGDELRRSVWEETLRPKIANWLAENDPEHRFQKIVTLYGTPLVIGKWEDDRETKPWRQFYQQALELQTEKFNESLEQLGQLVDLEFTPVASTEDLSEYRMVFDSFANEAQAALAGLPAKQQTEARAKLQATVQQIAGVGPFLASLRRDIQAGKQEAAGQFEYLRGRTEALSGVALLLEQAPASFERESVAISLLQQSGGQLAVIGWIQQQIKMVDDNDSAASLDSELACVLWPEYRRLGTVPNFAHPSFRDSPLVRRYSTFVVRRLDGPTVDVAKSLVDRALAAKDQALEGNVYLDLRGIQQGDTQTVRLERWLRSIGKQMETVDGLEVTIEDTPQLFDEAACPETVLYCGWYSLGKAIDSFTFQPGAVAYHLVPFDAAGIHEADDNGWCRYFLEKGATNVLGSVTEAQPVDFEISGEELKFHAPVLSSGMIEFGL